MDFQFETQENCLIIKLYGMARANERVMGREDLMNNLENSPRRVIVDLSGLKEESILYILGIINTIKKEVQFLGGAVKLCSLGPLLYHFLQEHRLEKIFDIHRTVDQAQRTFKEVSREE